MTSLTFIWLSQHKHLNRHWSGQGLAMGRDMLSMHPRGRTDSFAAYDSTQTPPIATISIEPPPSYEDALANSKPLYVAINGNQRDIVLSQQVAQDCNENSKSDDNCNRDRKISYVQLNVSQILLLESPPKYEELSSVNRCDSDKSCAHTGNGDRPDASSMHL